MLLWSPRVLLAEVAVYQPHHIRLVLLDLLEDEAFVEQCKVLLKVKLLRHLGRVHARSEAVLIALVLLLPLARRWGSSESSKKNKQKKSCKEVLFGVSKYSSVIKIYREILSNRVKSIRITTLRASAEYVLLLRLEPAP